jgi:peptide-methionine (S)-S-oxide reductase
MNKKIIVGMSFFLVVAVVIILGQTRSAESNVVNTQPIPAASADTVKNEPNRSLQIATGAKGEQTAVFAGGCFWGVEAVFEHVKGVKNATSGYSGGSKETADYEAVSNGETEHAEAVKITFDASQVSFEQLLEIFFSVAHDPTEINRQGPDTGTQYRSAIFYSNDEQKRIAETYIAKLTEAKTFSKPIATQVAALDAYYPAEEYHQDYLARNPDQPYIVMHDQPKLENLRKRFPELYSSK